MPTAFEAALLKLHQATDVDALLKSVRRLVEAAMPVELTMALPCDCVYPSSRKPAMPCENVEAFKLGLQMQRPSLLALIIRQPGVKMTDTSVDMKDADLLDSPYYHQVMRPGGWRHEVNLFFWNGSELHAHLGVRRTAAQGGCSEVGKAMLMAIHPHIDVAIRRVEEIARRELACTLLKEALEHPSSGLVLLDSRGRMVYQNHAACVACMIWKDGGSATARQIPAGMMIDLPPCVEDRAKDLLSRFHEDYHPGSSNGGELECEISHPNGEAVIARVRVVAPRRRAMHPHVRVEFARLVKGGEALTPRVPLYSLSKCEHRVALLVARGLRNKVVAAELGVSVHTVRAHLREVFSKLGVDHRGQLAKALAATDLAEPDYSV